MKKTILTALLSYCAIFASAQNVNFDWAIQNGQYGDDRSYAVFTDPNGNVYYGGNFIDSTDADPGPATVMIYSGGDYDGYVCKLDSLGNFMWVKHFAGNYDNWVKDIFIDNQSNVYVTETFVDTADADPGIGIHQIVSAGGYDGVVVKLDSNGDFVWAAEFGGPSADFVWAVTADNSGNVYVCGRIQGSVNFGSINIFLMSNNADAFLAGIDSNGQFSWATHMGSSGNSLDEAVDIVLDASGNVYTVGNFRNTAEFNPNGPSFTITALGGVNAFITKHLSDGSFVWAKALNGAGGSSAYGVGRGANSSIWIAGSFDLTVDFDPGAGSVTQTSNGGSDAFFVRLDNNGNYLWSGSAGGSSIDLCRGMTTDDNGAPCFVGIFSTSGDLNTGTGVTTLTALGYTDIFVLKLDTAGNFSWVKQIGGTSAEEAWDVAVHDNRNIYTTGFFNATLDFDPGVGYTGLTALGVEDGFLQKMHEDLMTSVEVIQIQSQITVFPVPASDKIMFSRTYAANEKPIAVIFDINGKLMAEQSLNTDSDSHSIDVSQLPAGEYILEIRSEQVSVAYSKFVKQ